MPEPSITFDSVVSRLRAAGCVFAEDEARMLRSAARTPAELDAMTERRAAGLPLEHVVGWAEFCGLRVRVGPGVFVPRRRTEFLVRRAAALAPPRPVVLDLCCGSGALGAALVAGLGTGQDEVEPHAAEPHAAEPHAAEPHAAELHAADIEPESVRYARRNVEPLGGRVHEGDLYDALPADLRGRVDVLLCNVPYVPSQEVALLPAEARDHEPRVALDGGPDGLAVLRRVTAEASGWLAPGGRLLFETSERQVPDALAAVARGGLAPQIAHCEEFYATVVIGTKSF